MRLFVGPILIREVWSLGSPAQAQEYRMRRPLPVTLLGLLPVLCCLLLIVGGCPGTTGGTGATFNLPPTVKISVIPDPPRGVPPLLVQFDSSQSTDDGLIVDRRWDFGDGTTSREIAPLHTYTTRGTYTVRLTLTDDAGAAQTGTITVAVTERPIAFISIDPNTASAENAPATFTFDASSSYDPDAAPGDTLSYRWDFGDGSREIIARVRHTFAAAGVYRVTLTVTDASGATGTADRIVSVGIPRPTLQIQTPPSDVVNIVCSKSAPLWIQAVANVAPGIPYTTHAGLDGDTDDCDAQTVVYDASGTASPRRLTGHSAPVQAAVFSPDSAYVLSGSEDGTAKLFEVATGDVVRTYRGSNTSTVNALAFSPNGAIFLLGRANGALELRRTSDNTILFTLTGHTTPVQAVAFAPDGTLAVSGDSAGVAILWDVINGIEVRRFTHADGVTAVAFPPTRSDQFATGCRDQIARLWSTLGTVVQQYAPVYSGGVLVAGHSDAITSVAFSSDGTQLLTGGADRRVSLWQTASGAWVRWFIGHTERVNAVGFAPNGQHIVSGSDDTTLRVWSVSDPNSVQVLQPCSSAVRAAAYSPDGQMLLAGIAARNSILLDADFGDGVSIADLDLRTPVPLDLKDPNVTAVEGGSRYYLWAEVRTDRTAPVRRYASAVVHVVPDYASSLATAPPIVPLVANARGEEEAVIVTAPLPPAQSRQIIDLGALETGDRVYLSLVPVPGFMDTYTNPGYSLMMLDVQEQIFVWYGTGRLLFTPESKLVVGHPSGSYYLVMEGLDTQLAPSVRVRVKRGAFEDSQPRQQTIYLNFAGTQGQEITVAGSPKIQLGAFRVNPLTDSALQATIVSRVESRLAPYGFVVLSSSRGDAEPSGPHNTVYFDTDNALRSVIDASELEFWGLTSFIDPRNQLLSGRAVVDVNAIINAFHPTDLATGPRGTTIANVVLHHIGLMSGLYPTTDVLDDVMTIDDSRANAGALDFTTAPLAPLPGRTAIGIQNAPLLLTELFGP